MNSERILVDDEVRKLCEIIEDNGHQAWLVGGALRDLLLYSTPKDRDIATDALPQVVMAIFAERGYRTFPVGEKFGTILLMGEKGKCEITTFRSEGKYTDKRHPDEVKFETDITKDLSRRDFTVNAIGYRPKTGEFYDPFNGRQDIEEETIRAVGNPVDRFEEDPLRMLRMVRLSDRLEFRIDKDTLYGALECHKLITQIPFERITEELLKIFSSSHLGDAIAVMVFTGLFGDIFPELQCLSAVVQPEEYHYLAVLGHCIEVANLLPEDQPLLRLAGLLHDVGKTEMKEKSPYFPDHVKVGVEIIEDKIAPRLKLSVAQRNYILTLVKHHMDWKNYPTMDTVATKRYMAKFDEDVLSDLFLLQLADIACSKQTEQKADVFKFWAEVDLLRDEDPPLHREDLAVNGNDLKEIGIPPSATMGRILDELLDDVLGDPTHNNREYLLSKAKDLYSSFVCK